MPDIQDFMGLVERLTNPHQVLDTSNPQDVLLRSSLAPLIAGAAIARAGQEVLGNAAQFGAGATLPRAFQHQDEERLGLRAPLFPLMPTADTVARQLADAGAPTGRLAMPTQPAPPLPAVGVAQDVLGSLGDVIRQAQQNGPQEALQQTQAAYEQAPQQFEGQKWAGQALFDPLSYLGTGAYGPVDRAFQEGVGQAFTGLRGLLGDAARGTPIAGKAFELSNNAKTSRVGQGAQNVVSNLGVAMQQLEAQLGESLFPRDALGNLSVARGLAQPTGEVGPLTMANRPAEAVKPGLGPQEGARTPQYASTLPVKGEAPPPAPAAQAVLDTLTPEAKQAWLDTALQGKAVPANRTPEQEAWHRWQQMAEGDLRDADKAATYFGVATDKGQPRDLQAILDAATAKTGDDGTAALDLARQHAEQVGITPPRFREENGRQFSTRGAGSGPAKNVIETTGDVRAALKQLGADEDTIKTAEARFIFDRYGDTLPVNPSGVRGYNDQAVALRLQRETGGVPAGPAASPAAPAAPEPPRLTPLEALTPEEQAFGDRVLALVREQRLEPDAAIAQARRETGAAADVPPIAPESDVAPSPGDIVSETAPPPPSVPDLTPPGADAAAGVVPEQGASPPRPPVPPDVAPAMPSPDTAIPLGGDTASLRAEVLAQGRKMLGAPVDEQLPKIQAAASKYLPALDQDRAAVQDISKSLGGAKDWNDLWDRVNAMPVDRPDLRTTLQQARAKWGGADLLRASDDDILLHKLTRDYAASLDPSGKFAARLDNAPNAWSDLTTIWRQQALAAPSYHVMNVMDAVIKSFLTMGQSGFTEGARPWVPGEGLDLLKQAWAKAGGQGEAFNPVLAKEFADRGIAAPASILQGSNTTQIAAGRGLESERAGGLGRLFRTNHEFGKGIEESARSAAFLQEYDKALQEGAAQSDAYQRGIDWANKLHFDYTATTNADEQLRKVLGFHIFATRNLALYPEILATHPVVARALVAYDQEVKQDATRGGYSKNKRIASSIPVGGEQIANLFFGRDGQIFFNPLRYLSIAEQVLGDPRENKGITGVGKALNTLGQVGLGPAPWLQVPLQTLGVYGNQQPQNLLRLEPLVASGASLVTGKPEESFWRAGMRGVQERLAGEGLTFAEGKQSAPTPLAMPVNIRVIERVLESPEGQLWTAAHPQDPVPPAAKQAIAQGHGNPLWDQAARELAAQGGQERVGGLLGAPIAFQSQGAAQISADSAGLPDRNAAGGSRPLDPTELLPGTAPGTAPITTKMRQDEMGRRSAQGRPGALALQAAFPQDLTAEHTPSAHELRRQAAIAKYFSPRTTPAEKQALLANPVDAQFILAEAIRRSPMHAPQTSQRR